MSPTIRRLPLLAAGAIALLAGLLAGLERIGWNVPVSRAADLVPVHGPLMVCGFFGTLIGLERAVALARPWAYGAPLFAGLGGLALLAGAPASVAAVSMLLGAFTFLAINLVVIRRQPALYTLTLTLGAAAWVIGVVIWLATGTVSPGVAAFACFLVFTIAGERLELSRFMPPGRWKNPGAAAAFSLLLGAATLLALDNRWGPPLFGVGLLALSAWMFRHDVARRSIRQQGLTRYMAACLLSGYVWLAAGGVMSLTLGLPVAGPLHDAVLHSLFVGFVFAMVFGHAPVILPAVFKFTVPYHAGLYVPLVLLHGALLLRITGDLAGSEELRRWGGLFNALVIIAFLLTTAVTVAVGQRARAAARAGAGARTR